MPEAARRSALLLKIRTRGFPSPDCSGFGFSAAVGMPGYNLYENKKQYF